MPNEKIAMFRIVGSKKTAYYEHNPGELNFNPKDCRYSMQIGRKVSEGINKNTFKIELDFTFYNEGEKLLSISSIHVFEVQNYNEIVKIDKNQMDMPDKLIAATMAMSISGTRGMLSVLNCSEEYRHITIPVLDPVSLLKGPESPKETS